MLPDQRKDTWLDTAVSGIRFRMDRNKVRKELEDHIEDKIAGLRRSFPDIPEEETWERVLAGMGDAEELKVSLAEIHKPWWGRLWRASQWALWGIWMLFFIFQMGIRTDFDNSLRGRSGTEVYHPIQDGEKARLGQYTFQITGAACVDRSHYPEAQDTLQLVLRASSPKFWERISIEAVLDGLVAVGPDGKRHAMNREEVGQYTVTDGLGGSTTSAYTCAGGRLCQWEPWYREFAIFIPAEGWEPGDRVTLELDSPAGKIELSAPVTERVVIP